VPRSPRARARRSRSVSMISSFRRRRRLRLTTRSRLVVTRQVYLGIARDYMVEVADGTALRVTTPTETNVPKGSEVWLTLPPDRCRALSR